MRPAIRTPGMILEFLGLLLFDRSLGLQLLVGDALSRRSLERDLLLRSTGSDRDLGIPAEKQLARRLSNLSSSSELLSLSGWDFAGALEVCG